MPDSAGPGPDARNAFLVADIEQRLRDPGLVAAWLEPRIGRVSGVTLREAVKPLPPETAPRLLAAYRARGPALRAR